MHETHYARSIAAVVRNKRPPHLSDKPVTVRVRLSPMSHVSPDQLRAAFGITAESECLNGVTLVVEPLELELYCRDCKRIYKTAKPSARCPGCGGGEIDAGIGREFYVEALEFEQ